MGEMQGDPISKDYLGLRDHETAYRPSHRPDIFRFYLTPRRTSPTLSVDALLASDDAGPPCAPLPTLDVSPYFPS